MLIGITGRRESGKDTVGNYLHRKYGFHRYAFADKVKELVAFGLPKHQLGLTHEGRWDGPKSPEARHWLQAMGHGARQVMGARIWIMLLNETMLLEHGGDPHLVPRVITDMRYQDEVDYVRKNGGYVWKITRPDIARTTASDLHPTETQVDAIVADIVIDNCGTLDNLFMAVDSAYAVCLARRAPVLSPNTPPAVPA